MVMPFELKGAPVTFALAMFKIFHNLAFKSCLAYLDDIILYNSTFAEHLATLTVVVVVVVSQFNGTSTPKGLYSAKTGDNDCHVNSSRYNLSTALCESNSLSGQV